MKELILNALTEAGIETDGLSDDQLLAKYNEMQAHDGDGGGKGGDQSEAIAQAVTNAIKPLQEEVTGLKTQLSANADAERAGLIETVVNSKKYPGLDEAGAKALPLESLKAMAANCGTAHGVPLSVNDGGQADGYQAPAEMPK